MDIADPTLTILRIDIELPTREYPNAVILEPNLIADIRVKLEPNLA
jgi:hypothetical protein